MQRCWPCFALLIASTSLWGKTYALLIGISDYRTTELTNLRGPRNDLDLMRGYLKRSYDHPEITTLENRQATHSAIIAALENLQKVGADDTVIIFYAGHGSQTCDLNNDEKGGLDGTWVTYGSRAGAKLKGNCQDPPAALTEDLDNYDLSDDELGFYLAKIPTEKIILISDSCHSGSISRDGEPMLVRGGDRDPRPHPMGTLNTAQLDKGIRLAATRDMLNAYEHQVGDRYYGLFTWNLVRSLEIASKAENWNDVMERTKALMREMDRRDQEPQIEGNREMSLDFTRPVLAASSAAVQRKDNNLWVLNPKFLAEFGLLTLALS